MPRRPPQCRHLISVEDGAPSGQSKTIPSVSQLTQTTSNSRSMRACGAKLYDLSSTYSKK